MTLLEQLQGASEGNRELSDQVLLACGWTYGQKDKVWSWWDAQGNRIIFNELIDPTRNLHDAVSLVPEGWIIDQMGEWRQRTLRKRGPWYAILWRVGQRDLDLIDARAQHAPTPALAVCIAIIKVHEAIAEAAE